MEIMYNDFISKAPDISKQIWDRKTDRQKTNMLKDFIAEKARGTIIIFNSSQIKPAEIIYYNLKK